MIKRTTAVALLFILTASLYAAPGGPPAKDALSLPINGTFVDAVGGTGNFNGTFQLLRFTASGDQLLANGYVSGTLTDSTGRAIGSVMRAVSIPTSVTGGVAAASKAGRFGVTSQATCDILNLVLGPLHLDVLGLTVDLNQVVLDIGAETGSGNLLGNLLCAVTNLLNGVGSLVDIANLLNRILDILTGVLG